MGGSLSPAELPFGARVRAVFTKYDGSPHWEYDLVVLGVDDFGVWVGGAPGGLISRPGREFVSDAHWVCLYPHDGMWVATFNGRDGSFSSRIYIDVTTTPSWWHRPDGVLSVSAIDLDLDVIRRFDGELFVDDIDEFEEHRVEFGYPDDLVDAARRTTDWLEGRLAGSREPFDEVARGWLAVCAEHVHSDERGRALADLEPGQERPVPHPVSRGDEGASRGDGREGTHGSDDEDLLAVWVEEPPATRHERQSSEPRPPVRQAEPDTDDRPAVEVEYDSPVDLDGDYVAHYATSPGRDFDEATDIDTSPVDPAEVTGLLLTTQAGRGSPLWFDGRPVEPEEVGVSAELADHLRDWADRWARDFDSERGWQPWASIDDYEALGGWLGRRLKDEVGGIDVTLQLAHLGRSSLVSVPPADVRGPVRVDLDAGAAIAPGDLPVRGDIVTLDGVVGCFSTTVNARLEIWAEDGGTDDAEARRLRDLMAAELGPDYDVGIA